MEGRAGDDAEAERVRAAQDEAGTRTTEEFGNRFVAAIDASVWRSSERWTPDRAAGHRRTSSAHPAWSARLRVGKSATFGGGWAARTGQRSSVRRGGSCSLPAHRAGMRPGAAGPDNLAVIAQFVSLLGEVEQTIRCARKAAVPTANTRASG